MAQFVIELSDNKATSTFLAFIRSLSFVKKIEKISEDELDNRILKLTKSIKKRKISEDEIISSVRAFRKKG